MKQMILIMASSLVLLAGCNKNADEMPLTAGEPDYGRQLAPGQPALRLITDPARLPDIETAYRDHDELLLESVDQSVKWFAAPSSRNWFPLQEITHDQARASVHAMAQLLEQQLPPADFTAEFLRLFDVYESVGYNDEGIVLFTGYFSPEFKARRTASAEFAHPLYTRPADLVTEPLTGEPRGRSLPGGGTAPYPTRREIEESKMLAGSELVWMQDALAAYIIHVNGSAKLRLEDESTMYIGYAGKTDRPYASLGQAIVAAGMARPGTVTLKLIKNLFKSDPTAITEMMYRNACYVFFREYDGGSWPSGSLGVRVTSERSLATDKKIYPRGGLVLVNTMSPTFSQGQKPFLKFLLDQDTGGAIRAPGRADIYMGIGPSAEILAGSQYAEGRLYYFFLKTNYVPEYLPVTDSLARAMAGGEISAAEPAGYNPRTHAQPSVER